MNPNYEMLPEHMRDGMRRYIENGIEAGSFMTAVLENDLMGALGKADEVNRECIFSYGQFLYNEVPSTCFGSPEKVAAWIERGGVYGHAKAAS